MTPEIHSRSSAPSPEPGPEFPPGADHPSCDGVNAPQALTPEAPSAAPEPPVIPAGSSITSRLRGWVFAPVKLVLGMLSCQSFLGALVAVGWTYRLMQRTALKHWWNQSRATRGYLSFSNFAASDSATRAHLHWPNWFLAQNFRETVWRHPDTGRGTHALTVLKALYASLWINVRLGVQGIFNTWVLTLPGCTLWLFAWYAGWQNSFNKGYEEFWIGPAVGWSGILLFMLAMLYVPMAQARQAVSGDWRRFYDFRFVWSLVRRRWPACLGLAALYSVCSIPVMILIFLPSFFPQFSPALNAVTLEDTDKIIWTLRSHFFWSALLAFPAFVLLRIIAARIYGSALLRSVQSGAIAEDALAESEWRALHRLDLLRVQPAPRRHPVVRAIAWAGTRAGRITFGIATSLVWFTFAAQIFVAQFFNYRVGPTLWLNHPLVQLPWLLHLPAWMKNPWVEVALGAVVVFLAWRVKKLAHWVKSWRRPAPSTLPVPGVS